MTDALQYLEVFLRGWKSGGSETPCGSGSTLMAASRLRRRLPFVFEQYEIKSINDCGCGDAGWIHATDLGDIDYLGLDCVKRPNWIELTKERTQSDFLAIDFVTSELRMCDLAICRDVMTHLPSNVAIEALNNLRSSSRLLLATSFVGADNSTRSLKVGGFSPLDLTQPPFALGKPIVQIPEKVRGKFLGLWRG